jgi:hypothetical protein
LIQFQGFSSFPDPVIDSHVCKYTGKSLTGQDIKLLNEY